MSSIPRPRPGGDPPAFSVPELSIAQRHRVWPRLGKAFSYLVLLAGAALFAAPFIWMLSTSVKPDGEVFSYPPTWIPSRFEWAHYTQPWKNVPFPRLYLNTSLIAGGNILGTLLSSSLVAFAFARLRFRWRGPLFVLVLATMMLPEHMTLIPLYRMWSKLHLIDTLWPLIIPALFGNPFNIFLIRQYMMTIPFDLDDAARIEGAGWFQVYRDIVLPQSLPALGVVAIFQFTYYWNEFLKPLVYLNTRNHYTVQLGLSLLRNKYGSDVQGAIAQTVLSIIPILIVFFVAQRRFVQGIVVSGVKG